MDLLIGQGARLALRCAGRCNEGECTKDNCMVLGSGSMLVAWPN